MASPTRVRPCSLKQYSGRRGGQVGGRGRSLGSDSLISRGLEEGKRDPNGARPDRLWAPGPRQTLGGIATTRGQLLLGVLDNVRGRLLVLERRDGAWRRIDVRVSRPNAAARTKRGYYAPTGR